MRLAWGPPGGYRDPKVLTRQLWLVPRNRCVSERFSGGQKLIIDKRFLSTIFRAGITYFPYSPADY